MPKYYVQDSESVEQAVLEATDPQRAILICLKHRFKTALVGGIYIVSERGFDFHIDDHYFLSDEINELFLKENS